MDSFKRADKGLKRARARVCALCFGSFNVFMVISIVRKKNLSVIKGVPGSSVVDLYDFLFKVYE